MKPLPKGPLADTKEALGTQPIKDISPLTTKALKSLCVDTKLNKTSENLYAKTQGEKLSTKFSSGQTFGLKQLTFFPEMEETGQFFEDIGGIHISFSTNQPACLPLLLTGLHFPCSQ
jgi:hypothetical protein